MKYDGNTVKAWAGDSQWCAWRADYAHYKAAGVNPLDRGGFWALTVYRLQRAVRTRCSPTLALPLRLLLAVVRRLLLVLTRIDLCPHAVIGPGLIMIHGGPIVIGLCEIGADCSIFQMTTIGAGPKPGDPKIGDSVFIGCHACVLGGVAVGTRAKVGAGAVVVDDIPASATAVGVPAKSILKKDIPGREQVGQINLDQIDHHGHLV